MTDLDKKAILKTIEVGDEIFFDYVTADMSIKAGKQVAPKEIKDKYLYAEDAGKIKRYLLDGIQNLKIIYAFRSE